MNGIEDDDYFKMDPIPRQTLQRKIEQESDNDYEVFFYEI